MKNYLYDLGIFPEGIHAHLYINGKEFHKGDKLPEPVKAGTEV